MCCMPLKYSKQSSWNDYYMDLCSPRGTHESVCIQIKHQQTNGSRRWLKAHLHNHASRQKTASHSFWSSCRQNWSLNWERKVCWLRCMNLYNVIWKYQLCHDIPIHFMDLFSYKLSICKDNPQIGLTTCCICNTNCMMAHAAWCTSGVPYTIVAHGDKEIHDTMTHHETPIRENWNSLKFRNF